MNSSYYNKRKNVIQNESWFFNTNYGYNFILEAMNEVIWELSLQANDFFVYGSWENITGYNSNEIMNIDKFINDIVFIGDRIKVKNDIELCIKSNTTYFQSEFRIVSKQGQFKWILMHGKTVRDDEGRNFRILGSIIDITERKKLEEEMRYMAYHDLLTGLPNKSLFMDKLRETIGYAKNNKNVGSVIFVDIDNFKIVNDTLGHDYGDLLLKIVAQLLNFCIEDYGMLARFGGDEFLILIPNIENEDRIKELCNNILENFKNPFEVNEKQVYCSLSMGICLFNENSKDINEIIKNADTAMYNSKNNGKNTYSFFHESMITSLLRKKVIDSALRNALVKNEFELYFQPQFDSRTQNIEGVEALLRWNSSELGIVGPNEFIPVAEETGLILKIGEWVINNACKQAKEWKEKGYKFGTMSINISPIQIGKEYLVDLINKALEDNKLLPNELEIEITEWTLIKSIEEKSEILKNISKSQVKIAIDDFGKGYSSLNYLTKLPINTLKIDKSFIDRITENKSYFAIVECIIQLANRLNYNVVAEGVEYEEQYTLLKNLGCNLIQGYYFSKPLSKYDFEKMLNDFKVKLKYKYN